MLVVESNQSILTCSTGFTEHGDADGGEPAILPDRAIHLLDHHRREKRGALAAKRGPNGPCECLTGHEVEVFAPNPE